MSFRKSFSKQKKITEDEGRKKVEALEDFKLTKHR